MENAKIIWQVAGKVKVQVAGKSKISCNLWRVAGKYFKWQDNMVCGRKKYEFTVDLACGRKYMDNAKIIWQVAGKVKFQVSGKSKISC